MSHIIECSQDEQNGRNTGASEQCLEGVTIRHALATDEQEFTTVANAKDLSVWKGQVADKKIIPLYEIEELTVADTEDTFFEGREKRYKTSNGKKIRKFNCFLGLCSHYALKSYHGKKMRIFEFTDMQEIKAVTPDGTKVKGQLVTIEVGKRVDAMPDKPAHTPVTITYADYNEFEDNGVVLKPTWSQIELEGIYDVVLELVEASSTSVKFKVLAGCSKTPVTSLITDDITFKTAAGVAISHSFVAADTDGIYEFTGTGFANTNVIDLDGVVAKTEGTYESTGALSVTGIS